MKLKTVGSRIVTSLIGERCITFLSIIIVSKIFHFINILYQTIYVFNNNFLFKMCYTSATPYSITVGSMTSSYVRTGVLTCIKPDMFLFHKSSLHKRSCFTSQMVKTPPFFIRLNLQSVIDIMIVVFRIHIRKRKSIRKENSFVIFTCLWAAINL